MAILKSILMLEAVRTRSVKDKLVKDDNNDYDDGGEAPLLLRILNRLRSYVISFCEND
jgi:hypothetical protein